jgi:predicted ribosome quality control (RQC) complex YloA/Tae2 family protein
MKIEKVKIGEKEITFYIGKTQTENFEIIDTSDENDLWFHLHDLPSCHVIACLKNHVVKDKKELRKIVVAGASLCKKHSPKYVSVCDLEIVYTKIKHITKTDIIGCVTTSSSHTKKIKI